MLCVFYRKNPWPTSYRMNLYIYLPICSFSFFAELCKTMLKCNHFAIKTFPLIIEMYTLRFPTHLTFKLNNTENKTKRRTNGLFFANFQDHCCHNSIHFRVKPFKRHIHSFEICMLFSASAEIYGFGFLSVFIQKMPEMLQFLSHLIDWHEIYRNLLVKRNVELTEILDLF